MTAQELFADGRFEEALEAVKNDVRKDATAVAPRIFLFQLMCVQGDWARALNQLNVIRDLDQAVLPMVQTYNEALQCEGLRAEVFAGRRTPLIMGDPPAWLGLMFEALQRTASGDHANAGTLREQALADAPATAGTIDGRPFDWIADADLRIGPCLEVIVNGRYYWAPFARIRSILIEAPTDLRDVVWMPAELTWSSGGQTVGLIPTRYPGTTASTDMQLLLARRTDWRDEAGIQMGLGQRLLATDQDDYPLMDVRKLELDVPDDG